MAASIGPNRIKGEVGGLVTGRLDAEHRPREGLENLGAEPFTGEKERARPV